MLYASLEEKWHRQYEEVHAFQENLSVVRLRGKYGFVNEIGFQVISPKYDGVWHHFWTPTRHENNQVFYNDNNYDHWNFNPTTAKVYIKEKGRILWGLVNKNGKEQIPTKYDDIRDFKRGHIVKLNGLYGLINQRGEEVIPPKYERNTILQISKAVGLLAFKLNINRKKAREILLKELQTHK